MSTEQRPDGQQNDGKTILFVYNYNIPALLHLLPSKSVSLALFIEISSSQNPQKQQGVGDEMGVGWKWSWWDTLYHLSCSRWRWSWKSWRKFVTRVFLSLRDFSEIVTLGFLTWPLAKEEFNEALWCENGCSDVWTGVCEWRTPIVLVYEAMGCADAFD